MNETKTKILGMIQDVERSLSETETAANSSRGVLNDVANLIIPMQRDQLAILKEIVDALPEEA